MMNTKTFTENSNPKSHVLENYTARTFNFLFHRFEIAGANALKIGGYFDLRKNKIDEQKSIYQ